MIPLFMSLKVAVRVVVAAVVVSFTSPVFSAAPGVHELVSQFDPVNYSNILANALFTRQYHNRFAVTGAHHDLCRDSIYTQFVNAGFSPTYDWFQFQDSNNVTRTACNVIAVKQGVLKPDEIFVAGAHYDSKMNPGADDNATGVAAILEMARIFNQYHFARTIVFVAFDCEEIYEYGGARRRIGSTYYVQQHQEENMLGMVSVDMIGHEASSTPNTAWLYGYASSEPVTNRLAPALITYGGLQVGLRTTSPNLSDHVAFANAGFPACLLIEAAFSTDNPFYHKSGDFVDQPGNISWNYANKMAKGALGYFAGEIQPVDIAPTGLEPAPLAGGGLRLNFSGLSNCVYAIEVSTDLSQNTWTPVSTNTAGPGGMFWFDDVNSASKSRAFYRARFVSGATSTRPVEIVLDNSAAVFNGSWTTGASSTDKFGADYRFAELPTDSYAEYRPNITVAGNYKLYEWHPQGTNRTTNAPVQIHSLSGTQTLSVNQRINGGKWNLLGTFNFTTGTSGYVRITDDFPAGSGNVVLADALRFVLETP